MLNCFVFTCQSVGFVVHIVEIGWKQVPYGESISDITALIL